MSEEISENWIDIPPAKLDYSRCGDYGGGAVCDWLTAKHKNGKIIFYCDCRGLLCYICAELLEELKEMRREL